jgi:hypothetical protein
MEPEEEAELDAMAVSNPQNYNDFVSRYFTKYSLTLLPSDETDLMKKEHSKSNHTNTKEGAFDEGTILD